VVFGSVAFADWLRWLRPCRPQNIRLVSGRIEALSTPGLVGVASTFARQTAVRHWRLVALVLGVYALGLIATAPATLIDVGLRQASEGRLRLAEARGTLWSGRGQVEIRDANRRTGSAKEVAWRLRPASLLRGQLLYELTPARGARHFPDHCPDSDPLLTPTSPCRLRH
jgi:hypothetical protein